MCETLSPALSDCPARLPCDSFVAIFRNDIQVGFSASYRESGYWEELLSRTQRMASFNHVALPRIANIQTHAWRWQTEYGHLTFVAHPGRDAYGRPVRQPFSVSFGPDAFAPHLEGEMMPRMEIRRTAGSRVVHNPFQVTSGSIDGASARDNKKGAENDVTAGESVAQEHEAERTSLQNGLIVGPETPTSHLENREPTGRATPDGNAELGLK